MQAGCRGRQSFLGVPDDIKVRLRVGQTDNSFKF
jgi:hypothetical protein